VADSANKGSSADSSGRGLERATLSESDLITQILNSSKTIAVVGLSDNPLRASHHVAEYLKSVGYQIVPVNPNVTEVLGEKSYERLQDVPVPVDIVDIFRRPEFVPGIVDAAVQVGARCVWMQEGVLHGQAAERARAAGLLVIMNLCMFKEHSRRARDLRRTKPL
jgi:predicted CoA-binding protein